MPGRLFAAQAFEHLVDLACRKPVVVTANMPATPTAIFIRLRSFEHVGVLLDLQHGWPSPRSLFCSSWPW